MRIPNGTKARGMVEVALAAACGRLDCHSFLFPRSSPRLASPTQGDQPECSARKSLDASTLAEVVIALAIVALLFGGIISAYVQTTRQAQWSAYSIAAQALSTRELEQARAARWDLRSSPPVDETINIPSQSVAMLDLPVSGTNIVWATNYASITTLTNSTTPLVRVKVVRVDTVWPFGDRRFTNTTVTYRAPDQ